MKKLYYAFVAMLFCVSCEEKADMNILFVDKTQLVFSPKGGSLSFQVECPMEWTVISDYPIDISPTKGNGNGEVTVTVPHRFVENADVTRVSVRAANGVTKSIEVHQMGVGGDRVIATNGHQVMGGAAGSIVRFPIVTKHATTNWVISPGPEWLEASFDGKTWFPVSGGIEGWRTAMLYFRATTSNDDEEARVATFTITETLFDESVKFDVIQVGKWQHNSGIKAILPNEIAVDYVFGVEVKARAFKLSEKKISSFDLFGNLMYWDWDWEMPATTDTYMKSYQGLKENTLYYLYCLSHGDYTNEGQINHFTFITPKSQDIHKVTIDQVRNNNGTWEWRTDKSEDVNEYRVWVTDDRSLFDASDAMIVWNVIKYFPGNTFYEDATHTYKGSTPFMIVTCVMDADFYGNDNYAVDRYIVK